MISKKYDDDLKHIHVLSFGGGVQSSALLIKALKGEINGVIPDYIIFSDTGWESEQVYNWVEKMNDFAKQHGKEIITTSNGSIRKDLIAAADNDKRMASLPFFVKNADGSQGMIMRQCTEAYKITPVNLKIRELLGYKPRQRVKEMVHIWKGISTDEIQRVKPIAAKWQTAEHPLIDVADVDRSACIAYVEREGFGTPTKSSCIGCPFHDETTWREMKKYDKKSFADAVLIDKKIRHMPKINGEVFLHRSCKPLDEVDFQENQIDIFEMFGEECEGFCGT